MQDGSGNRTVIKLFAMEKLFVINAFRHAENFSEEADYGVREMPASELSSGMKIDVDEMPCCGTTEIADVRPDKISVRWSGKEYGIEFGTRVGTERMPQADNSGTACEVYMEYEYRGMTQWDKVCLMITNIASIHEKSDSPVILETADEEKKALGMLEEIINQGNVGLYPLYALLSASNNWATTVIVRISQFREILLEGIEKGCLAPDCDTGWSWLEFAANVNDPETFMTDMDRYFDILMTAAENGNLAARDIMNTIWEPEQEIEED